MHVLARKEIYIVAKHVITHRILGEYYMGTKEQLAKLVEHTLKRDVTKEIQNVFMRKPRIRLLVSLR